MLKNKGPINELCGTPVSCSSRAIGAVDFCSLTSARLLIFRSFKDFPYA